MSTASSRQKASTPKQKQSERTRRKRGDASNPEDILVLIRLPDLSEAADEEAEAEEKVPVASVAPPPAATETSVRPPEMPSRKSTSADAPSESAAAGTTSGVVQPAGTSGPNRLSELTQSLRRRDLLRYAGPLAGVALIAVLLIAVALLLFGGDDSRQETPTIDNHRLLADIDPPILESPFPVQSPQGGGLPQLPAAPAQPAQTAPPVASQAVEPPTMEPTFTPPAQAAEAAAAGSAATAPAESPAEEAAAEPQEGESKDAEAAAPAEETAQADGAAESDQGEGTTKEAAVEPLASQTDESGDAMDDYKYPATDPATWNPDYSPQYQDLLLNPAAGGQFAPSATRKNNTVWEPSTARLNPEITAPPMR